MTTLGTLFVYSILLPLLTGIVFLKRLSKDALLIWGMVFIGTIPQLLKPHFDKTPLLNVAYNIYVIAEFIFLFFFFNNKFCKKILKGIFKLTVYVYVILAIAILILNGISNHFLNYLISLNSLVSITWILMIVLEQYGYETKLNITLSSSIFWFLSGMFLYTSCTIMIFLFWNFIQAGPAEISNSLRGIHSIFNINLYIFFSIGFLKEIFGKKNSLTYSESYNHMG